MCGALGDCTAKDRAALADRIRRGKAFVYVRRQVSPEQARRVAELELGGVGFLKENRRFYPNKTLAAHVLGHVGIDNVGLGGIEAAYDSTIKGRPGTVLIHVDAKRRAFSRTERKPTTGATLELTIDEQVQHIVERELREGVQWSGAAGASAVVMDPFTGELLAIASYPTFNPNAFRQSTDAGRRNRAIQDLYEPGSTFKIITASAALEERVVRPHDLHRRQPGLHPVRQPRDPRRPPLQRADASRTWWRSRATSAPSRPGCGSAPSGSPATCAPSASAARCRPTSAARTRASCGTPAALTDSALASTLIGYQVGVTPLQMATAVSAVANGGEVLQPRVVRAVTRDGVRAEVEKKVLRRAISQRTAAQLLPMLEGGGRQGARPRWRRWTATPWRARPARRRSSSTAATAGTPTTTPRSSASCPRATRGSRSWSSWIRRTACRSTAAWWRRRSSSASARRCCGTRACRGRSTRIRLSWSCARTSRRRNRARQRQTSVARVRRRHAAISLGVVPDVAGLSAREALRTLAEVGLTPRVHGAGFVVAQDPVAGTPLPNDPIAVLWLGRRPRAAPAGPGRP